jgi:hypothetical protein
MFSWEAVQCWRSHDFWEGFDKADEYWGLLRLFAEEMEARRNDFKLTSGAFRF